MVSMLLRSHIRDIFLCRGTFIQTARRMMIAVAIAFCRAMSIILKRLQTFGKDKFKSQAREPNRIVSHLPLQVKYDSPVFQKQLSSRYSERKDGGKPCKGAFDKDTAVFLRNIVNLAEKDDPDFLPARYSPEPIKASYGFLRCPWAPEKQ